MAIKNTQRGFALLIAVIFMSVMLALGLALGSLGYKQQVLASGAVESQYAFYVADAALECALYADQQQNPNPFAYTATPTLQTIMCDGVSSILTQTPSPARLVSKVQISLDSDKRCADVTVYKYASGATYLFSQGYDVSCATVSSPGGARFVSRGLKAQY